MRTLERGTPTTCHGRKEQRSFNHLTTFHLNLSAQVFEPTLARTISARGEPVVQRFSLRRRLTFARLG